jgi:hypothetical protein
MSSREVFQLADPDAEDYLSFGAPAAARNGNEQKYSTISDDEYILPAARGKGKGRKPATTARAKKQAASTEAELFGPLYTMRQQLNEEYSGPVPAPGEGEDEIGGGKQAKIPAKQVAEHQQLLMCLQRYAASARFAPMCKEAGLKLSNLETKSVAELKSLTTRVRTVCSSGGGASGMLYQGILTGARLVEKAAPKRLVNLDGYAASLRADPEFEAVAEMLELDWGFASTMTPMQRMGWCLGKHAFSVSSMNAEKSKLLANLIAQQQAMQAQQQQYGIPFTAPPPAPIVPPSAASVSEVNNPSQPIRTGAIPQYDD